MSDVYKILTTTPRQLGLDGIVVEAKVCRVKGPGFDPHPKFTLFFSGLKFFAQVFFLAMVTYCT